MADDFQKIVSNRKSTSVLRKTSVLLKPKNESTTVKTFEYASRAFKNHELDIEAEDRVGIIQKYENGFWNKVRDSYGTIGQVPSEVFTEINNNQQNHSAENHGFDTDSITSTITNSSSYKNSRPPPPARSSSKPKSTPSYSTPSSSIPSAPSTIAPQPPPAPPLKPSKLQKTNSKLTSPRPAVATNLGPVLDRLPAIKAYKNSEIVITEGMELEIFENSGSWWKVKSFNGGYCYVPKNIFPDVRLTKKKKKPVAPDAVSLKSQISIADAHKDIVSGNFKLKSVALLDEEEDDFVFSAGRESGKQRLTTQTSPVRRSPSKNRTPNITTMARLQRPDMDQVLVGIKSRISKENNSAYELKGRGRRGQQLEISPTSSKAEIRDWLNQIGDISDVTIDALSVLDGKLIFQLTKTEIKQICDDDWNRIWSHLTIQRDLFQRQHVGTLEKRLREVRLRQEQAAFADL